MLETIKLVFTQFNEEALLVSVLSLLLVLTIFIIYWFYNRKRFHDLSHQIPASVVKAYLDTIIQNSTALKSQLFRGGGLELGPGIASVFPTSQIGSANSVSNEVVTQKNAEIAALQTQLHDKSNTIRELESKLLETESSGGSQDAEVSRLKKKIQDLEAEITRLEKELADAQATAAAAGGDSSAVTQLTKDRDELKARLQEYEIIEDDLANLKRLQTENEQLKKELAELKGGGAPAAPAPAAPVAPAPAAVAAPPPPPPPPKAATLAPAAPAPAPADIASIPGQLVGEEKSAEDLLSEFEKMLG
ncbi:MAG: hypothetical protein HQK53_14535 [Oligoflexia bacterium]|nr:hypothetical protein [Oligoflexia bacterium]